MKKPFNLYKSISAFALIVLTIFACDRDFTSIESDIEGIKNFSTASKTFPLVAYNKKLNPVQTNGLSSNLLGIYTDPVYGQTTASVVTQIVPTTFDFNFGYSPEVESVILTIPYFTTANGTNDEGNNLYLIDSLFGNQAVKLSIYRNNYFLRDFDPNTNLEETQIYYSNANQTINFDTQVGELLYENVSFIPSPSEIIVEEINEETGLPEEVERIAPSLRVELLNENNFWDNLFFFGEVDPESRPEISNQNNFKDYFRGLYFKIESLGNNGHMLMMNFSQGSVVVNYSSLINEDDDPIEDRNDRSFRMNFTGNRLNIIENDPSNTIIMDADANADMVDGDELLYLKGGEGAFAIVDLFNGLVEDEDTGLDVPALDYFKSKKDIWLLNEANLIFYVNQTMVDGQEPDRVVLYDMENNVPIVDYFFDTSVNNSNPLNSKLNFSRILERDEAENGIKYKFRLTEHLNNILLRDSTNVKLGLFVTTNINEIQNGRILNSPNDGVSTGSILSPRGTVLHGSNQAVADDQRVRFEVFYTKPNN